MGLGKVWFSLVVLVSLFLNTLPALAVELKVSTENGITTIVYNGKNVFKGATKGKVSGKAVNDNGTELAAAFDDDRVIWENVTGAAERIKALK